MLHREQDIIQWAKDRNIFVGGTPVVQSIKTMEEAVELIDGVNKRDKGAIRDAIGDIIVTLVIQAKMQGLNIEECVEQAWNEIKDRRGRMQGGMFVKEEVADDC